MARGQPNPILDPSWTRVEKFARDDRPSSAKAAAATLPRDAMQVDDRIAATGAAEFDDDDDDHEWEYEETEHLITLDLGPESKRLLQMSHQYSITGLEGPTPFLRLGNVIFKGTWDQLIGTDILLRDHKDASSRGGGPSTSSANATGQHDLQPLPPTKTDLRMGRAPGTTRSRIQFRPAVNMVAREQALRNPAANKASLAPPSITHKGGWIWVRGKGWMRKEQMALLDMDQPQGQEEGNEKEADKTLMTEHSFNADGTLSSGAKKPGRKKMSLEEKMSQSVYKSMMKMRSEAQGGTTQASHAARATENTADAAIDTSEAPDAIMEA